MKNTKVIKIQEGWETKNNWESIARRSIQIKWRARIGVHYETRTKRFRSKNGAKYNITGLSNNELSIIYFSINNLRPHIN